MSTPLSTRTPRYFPLPGLRLRIAIVTLLLTMETLCISYLIQQTPVSSLTGAPMALRVFQHWLFRFVVVYVVSLGMLIYLRGDTRWSSELRVGSLRVSTGWAAIHALLLAAFLILSNGLYGGTLPLPFPVVAVAWHLCGVAAAAALFATVASLRSWLAALRATGVLPVYALAAASTAVLAIQVSQLLWEPTAQFTFRLVELMLRPLMPELQTDYTTLTVSTRSFAVTVSEKCSGLEGMGLMVAFCTTWLCYFRKEYRFPRALLIVPAALAVVFLLNAARIAALVLIGDAGYVGVAERGFHSQAGWIAFNFVALAVALFAKSSTWMHRGITASGANSAAAIAGPSLAPDPTAAFLMPLLAILAAGMLAHALSAGFEYLYPLRWLAALLLLWIYRQSYTVVSWRITWRGPLTGVLVAVIWCGFAYYLLPSESRPDALSTLPAPLRAAWIFARVAAASMTVPIAEELAFRGYLMRRLVSPHFETVAFSAVRWPALMLSSAAFGITHGKMWVAAIVAGAVYARLTVRRNSLGEAVAAHAATNGLLAAYVLLFDQWQLW